MYSAFRCERPALRRWGISVAATWAGVGKPVGQGSKRETNLRLIEEAAAPETCIFPIKSNQ